MKKFLLLNIFFLNSIFISAQDVDEVNSDSSGYVLLSTYEMAYGGKFKDLEKSLIEETKAGVKDGYLACGFDNWSDFVKAAAAADENVVEAISSFPVTGIVSHSDELLVRVYPK